MFSASCWLRQMVGAEETKWIEFLSRFSCVYQCFMSLHALIHCILMQNQHGFCSFLYKCKNVSHTVVIGFEVILCPQKIA